MNIVVYGHVCLLRCSLSLSSFNYMTKYLFSSARADRAMCVCVCDVSTIVLLHRCLVRPKSHDIYMS